ncbi:MAG: GxxExxY protein [Segetibacter sp.]
MDYELQKQFNSIEALNDIHLAQILTYLKLSRGKVRLLINSSAKLTNGLKSIVNNY